jgi:hypothetical protein
MENCICNVFIPFPLQNTRPISSIIAKSFPLPNLRIPASCSDSPLFKFKLGESKEEEELEVDYVFTATGYTRNAHEEILSDIKPLLPISSSSGKFWVKRDYSVIFDQGKVGENAGVWLQVVMRGRMV